MKPDDVTEQALHGLMPSLAVGDPDLIIRTSGERRISTSCSTVWPMAELHFADVLWPDFNEEDFYSAIESYKRASGVTG